ncbi:glucuronyl hydrolase, partial [Siphonobacter sp. BAB-5405]
AKADQLLTNLSKTYLAPAGSSHGFLLLHSTGSKPHNSEVDVPLIYADYYWLEALLRAKRLNEKKSLF